MIVSPYEEVVSYDEFVQELNIERYEKSLENASVDELLSEYQDMNETYEEFKEIMKSLRKEIKKRGLKV